jgi:type IV pilus assembly protein PilB
LIETEDISQELITLIPPKKAFDNLILPIKLEENTLYIGIPNKNDQKVIHDLAFATGFKIEAEEISPDIILSRLKEIYADTHYEEPKEAQQENGSNESNVDFVNQVISGAIKISASDIHFEVFEKSFRIRYRIDGHLKEMYSLPFSKSHSALSRLKIMANLDISEKRRPQDGKIRFAYKNMQIDIRVSTLPTAFGEKIVLRILDKSNLQLDLRKLGFLDSQYDIFMKNLHLPYGMILVTGPTGSGKTTTLYAALSEIHSVEKNIMTIEDPIEYNIDGINQANVKPDIGFDFASALRAFLRQDPDIVMVGEIRDKETAEIAIRASLTGHLVFSTLHTNDSISAITRLIDMGVEPFLVAASLRLIVAQRLVRMVCSCSRQNHDDPDKHSAKKGCSKCNHTGYSGRTALYELLPVTESISELISKNAGYSIIMEEAKKNNFVSLKDVGLEKIKLNISTYDEVNRETSL